MRQNIYCVLTAFLVFFISQVHAGNLKNMKQDLSDSVITTKITAQYTENKNLNPLKIAVSTNHGIVILSVTVKDKQAFVDALRIAKSTKGVKTVDTAELDIKKVNTGFTDVFITAKVETAVLKAKVLDDESIPLVGINATTSNGVVTLSGNVKNARSIASIIKRVNSVHGVKKIITFLQVKEEDA